MKPKTEELLYLLLWSCDRLARPTFRNLTDSFEAWAYRNGFLRQLAELERQRFLEAQAGRGAGGVATERLLRLTEAGRLHVLGGRDPESHWRRAWDGYWRLVLYDLPVAQSTARDRLRNYLRQRGLGRLQKSVWISPDPLQEDLAIIANEFHIPTFFVANINLSENLVFVNESLKLIVDYCPITYSRRIHNISINNVTHL